MEVDHFRPRGRPEFQHLEKTWMNLYYSCRLCNAHKLNLWPDSRQRARGFRFVDPCEEDPDDHFRLVVPPGMTDPCWVAPLTRASSYTVDSIRLNRRQLIDLRRQLEKSCREEEATLRSLSECLAALKTEISEKDSSPRLSLTEGRLERLLQECEERLGKLRAQRAFPLGSPA